MKKNQNPYETPHKIFKPVFSTGFLEKSRNFSKRGMGFALSLKFSIFLKTPYKTLSYINAAGLRNFGPLKNDGYETICFVKRLLTIFDVEIYALFPHKLAVHCCQQQLF